ncbi:hypothetical protein [Paenibacillus lactis]|uniref:hypothetical protein n=1 Tax=Paenibacillus lactis TaxID=228574 RepID=UPI00365B82D8
MRRRAQGERYRPIVTVMVSIDGMPVKVKISGKTYVLKAYRQKKGRWNKRRA